jgi:ribosome maturation factor RimP
MVAKAANEGIRRLLEEAVDERGLELVAVETTGVQGRPLVRVFLDREGGIDLDTICDANAWIGELLESGAGLDGPYVLEVSSPGVDRPLVRRQDYERFAGETVVVKTFAPVDGRKSFTGRLDGLDGDAVVVECDDATHEVPLEAVAKAHLQASIDFGSD